MATRLRAMTPRNVIGVNKLSVEIGPGVTGLLGPNGAGKSTFLQLATGQLQPSQGSVRVLGHTVWNHAALNRSIGLCPEQDAFYEWMTGWDFVFTCARLGGLARTANPELLRPEHLGQVDRLLDRPPGEL